MTQAAKDAAKFLKSTLRLPTSTFPPRPPPADLARYLPRCTDDLYAWQRQTRPASKPFVLHDGPPYANGDLHVGHALNKIIKDIICRTKLAEGRQVDYVPGWDCHGLPIELKALEKHGWKRGQDVDSVTIRHAAREFAREAVTKQMEGFRSWTVMGDWDGHYETMEKNFELRQLAVFQALVHRGLIYRKNKPVYWSPSSGTALAEAELEYKDDHVSTAALVKFPITGFPEEFGSEVFAVIWTTTPWTLPANQAIAVHRDLPYSLVRSERHGRLVVAESRLSYLQECLDEPLETLQSSIPIDTLLRCTYAGLPEFGEHARNRPFIHASFVSADSGTGLVHCAPGHGMEDYEALQPLIKSGMVSVRAPVDNDGAFTVEACPGSPEYLAGKSAFSIGNASVLELLQEHNTLLHSHKYVHKYPIDWRTKEPIMIRATAQWFADVSNIREDTLQALNAVRFLPNTGKSRLRSFVENRTEWCISRQRAWGVPIPAIYHKTSGEAVLTTDSINHIIDAIKKRGIDAWWSDPPDEPGWIPNGLHAAEYIRGRDTMDVWFDSGTTWTSMLEGQNKTENAQADVYLEGTDQHRGWFQSSLLTRVGVHKSVGMNGPPMAPFKTLITHGFTLDGQGKKMSKSLGNVIAPAQIIAGLEPSRRTVNPSNPKKKQREVHPLGPDALRLWVAGSDWTKDVVISETVVKTVHTALDKYRVTFKLLLGLLQDWQTTSLLPYEALSEVDRIALVQLHQVSTLVRSAMDDFEFHRAVTAINRWVVTELSGFYFEAIKDVIYCDDPQSHRRRSAQTVLRYILFELQHMLGPILPLLVEESWEHSPESLRVETEHPLRRTWEQLPAIFNQKDLSEMLPSLSLINSAVKAAQERARTAKLMGQSLASDVAVYLPTGIPAAHLLPHSWEEILVVSKVNIFEDDKYATIDIDQIVQPAEHSWSYTQEILNHDSERIGFVLVTNPKGAKCQRCWKYTVAPDSKGSNTESPDVCGRCAEVVSTFKETRQE